MDMIPPQAPPAVTRSTQQPAIDALSRLVATQAWLGRQQQALPALPVHPTPEGRDGWLADLDAFWMQTVEDSPGAAPLPRVDALALRLADAMRDDAIVRAADGTLDANAAETALRFARATSGTPPPDIETLALRIGLADYAGAVIVRARGDDMPVLLFMPDRGWDVFANLDDLHVAAEARLRRMLSVRETWPGVRVDDMERVVADERFVNSRPLNSDVFRRLARRMLELQKQKLTDAWASVGETASPTTFVDETGAALDLHEPLDIGALLSAREERLAVAIHERRLSTVPEDVRTGWQEAAAGMEIAELQVATSAAAQHGEAPLTLAGFARRELKTALARHGIDVDPDDILIDVTGGETIASPALPGTSGPSVSRRVGFAELALRNIGWLDGRRFAVVADAIPTGQTVPAFAVLRTIVSESNLAASYETYLQDQLSDTRGSPFREASMGLYAARMRMDAAEARVASWLDGEPKAFLDDRDERGFRMVEAVLDVPVAASRATVGGHRVVAHELVYKGVAVSDVLVIGMKDPRSVSRVVLYTPGAPDGRAFREFSDRATAAREFLYAPAFESYLLDRLPVEFAETTSNGQRRFRVSDEARRSRWVFAAPGDGRGAITDVPFEDRPIDGSVLNALFHAELRRQANDLAFLGRSRAWADAQSVAGFLGLVSRGTDGAGQAVSGTIAAANQALLATWRFYDSVKAGDGAQAFLDFTDGYTSALAVGGWRAGLARAARSRLSLRTSASAVRRVDAGIRVPDPRESLDPRYAVRGVDLSGTRPDSFGVHRLHGRRYIRQHDRVFELRHDPAFGTWRLARPNALDAAFPGPALEPTLTGGWRLRHGLGLRGGRTNQWYVNDPQWAAADGRVIDGRDLHTLTPFQRSTLQQQLGRNLRSVGEAARIYGTASREDTLLQIVTLRQRTAWTDALRIARATPSNPLPVGRGPRPGDTWRVLDPADWPSTAWHRQGLVSPRFGPGGDTSLPLLAQPGSGLVGAAATSQAPLDILAGPLLPPPPSPSWFRLNLDRLRYRTGPDGTPVIRVIEVRRDPFPEYVIQPRGDVPGIALRGGDYAGVEVLTRSPTPSPPPSP